MDSRRLSRQKQAQHIDVEHPVELRFRDRFQGPELIDARVVDQDVESAIGGYGGVDQALRLHRLGHVAPDGDGLGRPRR